MKTILGILVMALALLAQARADIIEVESATSCPGSAGGGLCNGSSPFQLSALLALLSAPNSIGHGTQKYVVTNDIGNSFSFTLMSTGKGAGFADNGSCQINGGTKSIFSSCTLTSGNGHSTMNGGKAIGTGGNGTNFLFPATVTFSGAAALGTTFDLGFVSMQGTSSVTTTTVPEPSALVLFGSGLGLALGLVRKRFQPTQG
jgi:PEP-CTERM motif-containing protein